MNDEDTPSSSDQSRSYEQRLPFHNDDSVEDDTQRESLGSSSQASFSSSTRREDASRTTGKEFGGLGGSKKAKIGIMTNAATELAGDSSDSSSYRNEASKVVEQQDEQANSRNTNPVQSKKRSVWSKVKKGGLFKKIERKSDPHGSQIQNLESRENWRGMVSKLQAQRQEKIEQCFKFIGKFFVLRKSSILYKLLQVWWISLSFISSGMYAFYAAFLDTFSQEKYDRFLVIDSYYEVVFGIEILLNLFTEHQISGTLHLSSDIRMIWAIYLKSSEFLFDLIAIMPFVPWLSSEIAVDRLKLFLLLKLIRLRKGISLLHCKGLLSYLRRTSGISYIYMVMQLKAFKKRTSRVIPRQLRDLYYKLSQMGQVLQLVLTSVSLSVYLGIAWYFFCYYIKPLVEDEEPSFLIEFDFSSASLQDRDLEEGPMGGSNSSGKAGGDSEWARSALVKLTYFMFTTISTVGFGDFIPMNNSERLAFILVIIIGVVTAAFIVDTILTIIKKSKSNSLTFEQSEELSLFMATLTRMNGNLPLNKEVLDQLDCYFGYRWELNKNQALATKEGRKILKLMPWQLRSSLLRDFLFKPFLEVYQNFFVGQESVQNCYNRLRKQFTNRFSDRVIQMFFFQQQAVDWTSDSYQDFLNDMLFHLEPIQLMNKRIVQRLHSSVDQILFIMNGKVEVGYNHEYFLFEVVKQENKQQIEDFIHKKLESRKSLKLTGATEMKKRDDPGMSSIFLSTKKFHFPVELPPGSSAVGLFEMSFQKHSQFIYRIGIDEEQQHFRGFFLRARSWRDISKRSKQAEVVTSKFKSSIVINNYLKQIYLPIREYQNTFLKKRLNKKKQKAGLEIEQLNSQIQSNINLMKNVFQRSLTDIDNQDESSLAGDTSKSHHSPNEDKLTPRTRFDKRGPMVFNELSQSQRSSNSRRSKKKRGHTDSSSSSEPDSHFDRNNQVKILSHSSLNGDSSILSSLENSIKEALDINELDESQKGEIKKVQEEFMDQLSRKKDSSSSILEARQKTRKRRSSMSVSKIAKEIKKNISQIKVEQVQKKKAQAERKSVKKQIHQLKKREDPLVELFKDATERVQDNQGNLVRNKDGKLTKQELEMQFQETLQKLEDHESLLLQIVHKFHRARMRFRFERDKNRFLETQLIGDRSGLGTRILNDRFYLGIKSKLRLYNFRSNDIENLFQSGTEDAFRHQQSSSEIKHKLSNINPVSHPVSGDLDNVNLNSVDLDAMSMPPMVVKLDPLDYGKDGVRNSKNSENFQKLPPSLMKMDRFADNLSHRDNLQNPVENTRIGALSQQDSTSPISRVDLISMNQHTKSQVKDSEKMTELEYSISNQGTSHHAMSDAASTANIPGPSMFKKNENPQLDSSSDSKSSLPPIKKRETPQSPIVPKLKLTLEISATEMVPKEKYDISSNEMNDLNRLEGLTVSHYHDSLSTPSQHSKKSRLTNSKLKFSAEERVFNDFLAEQSVSAINGVTSTIERRRQFELGSQHMSGENEIIPEVVDDSQSQHISSRSATPTETPSDSTRNVELEVHELGSRQLSHQQTNNFFAQEDTSNVADAADVSYDEISLMKKQHRLSIEQIETQQDNHHLQATHSLLEAGESSSGGDKRGPAFSNKLSILSNDIVRLKSISSQSKRSSNKDLPPLPHKKSLQSSGSDYTTSMQSSKKLKQQLSALQQNKRTKPKKREESKLSIEEDIEIDQKFNDNEWDSSKQHTSSFDDQSSIQEDIMHSKSTQIFPQSTIVEEIVEMESEMSTTFRENSSRRGLLKPGNSLGGDSQKSIDNFIRGRHRKKRTRQVSQFKLASNNS